MPKTTTDPNDFVQLSTNHMRGCRDCLAAGERSDLPTDDTYFITALNHYRSVHGREVMHLGTETIDGPDGHPWQSTVAYLGPAAAKKTLPRPVRV